jgi:AraC-like DNA-binding protein
MQQPSLDRWTTVFLFAAVQGIFLASILFINKRGNRAANRVLAVYILLFSILLSFYVAYWSGYMQQYVHLTGLEVPMPFLFGPVLLMYLKLYNKGKINKFYFLHFVPFVIHVFCFLPFYIKNAEEKRNFLKNTVNTEGVLSLIHILNYSQLLFMSAYAIWMFFNLNKYKKQEIAHPDALKKYKWQRIIVYFFIGFVLSFWSYYILVWLNWLSRESDYGISFCMAIFIYTMGYLGFRQPEIFQDYSVEKNGNGSKYEKSSLTPEQSKSYLEQLIFLMDTEKPYLDSELKINDLAEKLNITMHHLSQVINAERAQNYNDFINKYRISEAQRLLLTPQYQDAKILSIAFDVGFNNKATFNAAFKKITGMSPSIFRKNNSSQAAKNGLD